MTFSPKGRCAATTTRRRQIRSCWQSDVQTASINMALQRDSLAATRTCKWQKQRRKRKPRVRSREHLASALKEGNGVEDSVKQDDGGREETLVGKAGLLTGPLTAQRIGIQGELVNSTSPPDSERELGNQWRESRNYGNISSTQKYPYPYPYP